MSHSPAPWKWREDTPSHLIDANGGFVVYLGAEFYPDDPGGCGERPDPDDASLIAASPDLLEACKVAETALHSVARFMPPQYFGQVMEKIVVAIKKAEKV